VVEKAGSFGRSSGCFHKQRVPPAISSFGFEQFLFVAAGKRAYWRVESTQDIEVSLQIDAVSFK